MEKNSGLRKGSWTEEEDKLLIACIQKYGEGKWHLIPQRAGKIIDHCFIEQIAISEYVNRKAYETFHYNSIFSFLFLFCFAGLKRCRKSCRLRWLNYLSPKINRGIFAEDEIDMIQRFHKLIGNR